jgi:hypothetical protein
MGVERLVTEMGVSQSNYTYFMKQNGRDKGAKSKVFAAAPKYLHSLEVTTTSPKKRKVSAQGPPLRPVYPNPAPSSPNFVSMAPIENAPAATADGIVLAGEMEDKVEVYDSCDEIRQKILMYLAQPKMTKAKLLDQLLAQFHGPRKPKSMQNRQLSNFLAQTGPMTGNTTTLYYAAYVFFEKRRIAAGMPKSEHRLAMEETYWGSGIDREMKVKDAARYDLPTDELLVDMNSPDKSNLMFGIL